MIEFFATTHTGKRYKHNEDAIGWNEASGLWFVADGIGGHARGDIASSIVKKTLLDAADEPPRSLSELVLLAHEAVLLEAIEQSLTNMGSTLVLARVRDNELSISWCGDSRAYLFRAGELVRLTRDHSMLEQLLEVGAVAPEEAFGHPRANILVQALGINDPYPTPGEIDLTLVNDDLLLLCSDGVHDELRDSDIADVASAGANPEDVVNELERRILATDARDNLSIICLRASGLAPSTAQPEQLSEIAKRAAGAAGVQNPNVDENVLEDTPGNASINARHQAEEDDNPDDRSLRELWIALAMVVLLAVLVVIFT